jgi:hypothetical protein
VVTGLVKQAGASGSDMKVQNSIQLILWLFISISIGEDWAEITQTHA